MANAIEEVPVSVFDGCDEFLCLSKQPQVPQMQFQLLKWNLCSLIFCWFEQSSWVTFTKDFCGKSNKSVCNDIFLCSVSSETSGFVDKLFESLYTKSYLPSLEPTKVEAKPAGQEKEAVKEEVTLFFSAYLRLIFKLAIPDIKCEIKIHLTVTSDLYHLCVPEEKRKVTPRSRRF